MLSLVKELKSARPERMCAPVCRLNVGPAEVVLLRKVLGVCLRLRVELSGQCRGR
ncbi:hypothetical protein PJ985_08875 [Streptomyces sp. ACA25]|uniref:hypothetical protein n=1 Tax=Streptomyces sp. ACA25 TaxID=3022596 RepID=UPI002307EF84|nr:hypothetical protein [Streptomyces sp. ACA25]MDB1087679.1 hypothetical protein [Streptomyces sp. ACA25]